MHKQTATKREELRQVVVDIEHVRMIVQLLQEPRNVLLLLRILHLDRLLHITLPQHGNERLVRELHLSLEMLLLEALLDGVQLLRLALHHHRLALLVLRHVVGAKLNRQIENALLVLILGELRVILTQESVR